jgi:glycosyltransferase involved in cell wall biosynthesis
MNKLSVLEFPLISIVMATYNGEQFIQKQLDSLVQQTYPNLEIIISDDQSTDRTVTILQEYVNQYSNIQMFTSNQNIGYIKNFEKAFGKATGKFIAPCDQDDVWMPTKLSELYKHKGDAKIIYCDSSLINEHGQDLQLKHSERRNSSDFNTCLNYLIGGSVPGHAMLIDGTIVKSSIPFPSFIPHDYWLGYKSTLTGTIKFYDACLVQYRQHDYNVFGAAYLTNIKKQNEPKKFITPLERIKCLYDHCPSGNWEKEVLKQFYECYNNDSFKNRFKRMSLFFKYNKSILAYKKRNILRRWAFCFKMFFRLA